MCAVTLPEGRSLRACPACLARLRHVLDQLPVLYVRLHTELSPRTAPRLGTARTARLPWRYRASPEPVRMPLLVHAEHTVHTVRTWALHALPGSLPTAPVRPGPLLQQLCRSLARNLPTAVQPPVLPEHPQAVQDAYLRALHLLHQDTAPQRLDTPCPGCDLRSLYRDAAGTVCHSCHSRFTGTPD
ncbi:hypothetical protein ACMATS_08745 [Streptoverticillium reticulum]|uniref:hypothetical protein n=1 Tax=Streptoverticillium reticulum TaxID=1433415 RepID=UPI0039BED7D0